MSVPPIPENFPAKLRSFLENRVQNEEIEAKSGHSARDDWDAYSMMAPQYAYGRHRGPAPRYSYQASVVTALIPVAPFQWSIPLTLRPPQMLDHAGQVSLPGGRSERNESVWETARREYCEELGCTAEHMHAIGTLPSLYVYASRHRVIPVIAVAETLPVFQPNPEEVSELLWLPLEQLLRPDVFQVCMMQRGISHYQAPGLWVDNHFVWGATAMVLAELRSLALQTLADASGLQ